MIRIPPRPATALALVPLFAALTAACHPGEPSGVGVACDRNNPCRAFLVCRENHCAVPAADDGGADAQDAGDAPSADMGDAGGGDRVAGDARPRPAALPEEYIFFGSHTGEVWLASGTVPSYVAGEEGNAFAVAKLELPNSRDVGFPLALDAQTVGREVNLLLWNGQNIAVTTGDRSGWTPWSRVASGVRSAGLADVQGTLWACALDDAGKVQLGMRAPNGMWTAFHDVSAEARPPAADQQPGPFRKIDCSGVGDALELVVLDEGGRPWHAARRPGGWQGWRRLVNAPLNLVFELVNTTESVGQLHALFATRETLYRTARSLDGTWTAFYDVEALVGQDPGGMVLSSAIGAADAELHWLEVSEKSEGVREYVRFQIDVYRGIAVYSSPVAEDPFVTVTMAITRP